MRKIRKRKTKSPLSTPIPSPKLSIVTVLKVYKKCVLESSPVFDMTVGVGQPLFALFVTAFRVLVHTVMS